MFTKNFYGGLWPSLVSDGTTSKQNFTDITGTVRNMYSSSSCRISIDDSLRNVRTNVSDEGVVFGNGDTNPTLDDYKLSGDIITTITSSYSKNTVYDEQGTTITTVYTITNTGEDAIKIGEIGLLSVLYRATNYTATFLIERTVLDEPITIPAGGVGQVTYAIRMEYPTA